MKIGIVTTTRADYGLLYPLIKKMKEDAFFQTDLIVSGTHLSLIDGYTLDDIENEGIYPSYKISYLDNITLQDKPTDICHIISVGINEFTKLFDSVPFDAIIVLGDRYELFSICIPALIQRIPIIHLYGGEVTAGAIDDAVRHCVTKLASVHFTTAEIHRKRVIALGENPKYVFNVGAVGVDNIVHSSFVSEKEFRDHLGIANNKPLGIITYHPVTKESYDDVEEQIHTVLQAACEYEGLYYIVTMPNADHGSKKILKIIEHYVSQHPDKFIFKKSLARLYLSALKICKIMIGNSSSGILEAPSFQLPVVNIGDRQKGRLRSKNIIDCPCEKSAILKSLEKGLSVSFRDSLKDLVSPFGDGRATEKIIEEIKKIDFSRKDEMLKKDFYLYNFAEGDYYNESNL